MENTSPSAQIFIGETLTLDLFSPENADQYVRLIKDNKTRLEDSFRVVLEELLRGNTEDYVKRLLEIQDAGFRYLWLVRRQDNSSPRYIGAVSIHRIEKGTSKCRLGYFIDKSAAGHGYGSLSVRAVTQYCFERLKMNKVVLRILPSNKASIRIAEKTGYKRAGLVRKEIFTFARVMEDALYYELLKADFKPFVIKP